MNLVKNEEKLLHNYFHSEAKQQGIKFISQVYTSLKVVSPFQLNKILKINDLVYH